MRESRVKLKLIRVGLFCATVVCAMHVSPGYWVAGLIVVVWALGAVDGMVAAIEVYEDEIAEGVTSEKTSAR